MPLFVSMQHTVKDIVILNSKMLQTQMELSASINTSETSFCPLLILPTSHHYSLLQAFSDSKKNDFIKLHEDKCTQQTSRPPKGLGTLQSSVYIWLKNEVLLPFRSRAILITFQAISSLTSKRNGGSACGHLRNCQ